ncbi:TPA: restriction endonuclease [Salmonella enterica subsp. enterica serovar Blitta]|nr:restriction endonuclease [Salmonella enterica subsp. enterica serovar Blitta]
MGRRKKDNGLGLLVVLIVFGYGAAKAYIDDHHIDVGSIASNAALVIIIAFIVILALKHLAKVKHNKIRSQTIKEDFVSFKNRITPHLPVLARKKNQLVVKDDYGYTNYDAWEREKDRYLKLIDYYPITNKHYNGLEQAGYSNYIDIIVDEYADENETMECPAYNDNITPAEYEALCADILKSCGWEARVTKLSGDQGVDVIAEKEGFSIAIQCKKYSNPVGNKAVQEVTSGKAYYRTDACAVVTNATYTPSARSLAKSQRVLLLHHTDLYNLDEKIEELDT